MVIQFFSTTVPTESNISARVWGIRWGFESGTVHGSPASAINHVMTSRDYIEVKI